MTLYRAVVVGCGKIGSEYADDPLIKDIYTHVGAYFTCTDTKLVAVCDNDVEKVRKCAKRWGVNNYYTDFEEMLPDQKPDIVSICTPDSTHYALIRTAILSPSVCGILAEKPISMNIDEAVELVRLSEKNNVILAVNYSRRYANNFQVLREYINTGGIGEIQTINGYYGKGTIHNGTHWFDLVRYLIGEIRGIKGIDVLNEGGDDPTLDVHLKFDKNCYGYLHGCNACAFTIFELDIIGMKGRVIVSESGCVIKYYGLVDSPYCSNYMTLTNTWTQTGGNEDALLHAVEDLIVCLKTGKKPLCSGMDGIEALRIALTARASAKERISTI